MPRERERKVKRSRGYEAERSRAQERPREFKGSQGHKVQEATRSKRETKRGGTQKNRLKHTTNNTIPHEGVEMVDVVLHLVSRREQQRLLVARESLRPSTPTNNSHTKQRKT
jgi:hypothetical protein